MVGALHPSLAALCGQQAFYDQYAAIPRELIHNQQLALVATGRAGPVSGTCQVGPPGYNKIPALSVLLLTAPLSGHQVMINGHALLPNCSPGFRGCDERVWAPARAAPRRSVLTAALHGGTLWQAQIG